MVLPICTAVGVGLASFDNIFFCSTHFWKHDKYWSNFDVPSILHHFIYSRKMPIKEFTLSKVLSELQFSQRQFIDLCIMLGCDYCESIKGIGPKRAIDLMRQYGSIETILENLDVKVSRIVAVDIPSLCLKETNVKSYFLCGFQSYCAS